MSRSPHILAFSFVVILWAALYQLIGHKALLMENGITENLQALLLLVACVMFVQTARKLEPVKMAVPGYFFAWLSLAFFIREIEPKHWDLPFLFDALLDGRGRAVFLLPLFYLTYMLIKNFSFYWQYKRQYLSSTSLLYIFLCGLLLVAGWPFDRMNLQISNALFYEEMLEISGYFFLLIAALFSSKLSPKYC